MNRLIQLIVLLIVIVHSVASQPVSLIPAGSAWKYLADGSNQDTAWRYGSYNDSAWPSGNAQLGYGDGDEATVIPYGPDPNNRYITYYFRKSFTVANPVSFDSLLLGLLRDDGAIVYLNGTEVFRSNMPAGTIGYLTTASVLVSGSGETTYYSGLPSVSLLLPGTNVIAAEVHQINSSNTDVSFDLTLDATPVAGCAVPAGLSSTNIKAFSALVTWQSVTNALNYHVQYRKTGAANWKDTTVVNPTVKLTSLKSVSTYEWKVQAVCAAGPGPFSLPVSFTTLNNCKTPFPLQATGLSSTTATLNWSAVNGATGYTVQYRKTGTSGWTTQNTLTPSFTASGLLPANTYEWHVRTQCAPASSLYSPKVVFSTLASGTDTLLHTNATGWKYLDDGSNQGTAWTQPSFNDAAWLSGQAELGYGDGDEKKVVGWGPDPNNKYVTTYFRKSFTVANPAAYSSLRLGVVRDDGIIVSINGIEVYRNNMPGGPVAYTMLALVNILNDDEDAWFTAALDPAVLVPGNNVITVEVHQQFVSSADLSFNCRLYASGPVLPVSVTRGAYLQKVTPTSITIRWRTDIETNSKVNFGTTLSYGNTASDALITKEHIVTLTGLSPNTRYYYRTGASNQVLQGDSGNTFVTAPLTGSTVPVRIWATGDFGNGSTSQENVRNAYMNYPGSDLTNLWIWLGDNAYSTGTDLEYQNYVFNVYPVQFKRFPMHPAIGNHDYGNAGYQSPSVMGTAFPYFQNFSMLHNGEGGGVASGTPKYYSYNYGNIHFIALDSYGSLSTAGSPMYNWLQSDLAANTQRWTIVYFHHPPYTKGTHNSDTEVESVAIRSNIIPLLESYHVDLVLCGHSHINERSYLIKGHYGLASTFNSSMKTSTAFNTFTKSPPYDGTIYAICGTSGQNPGPTQAGYPMPCMYFSNNTNNCSLVLDVNGDNLSMKYLTSTGVIADQIAITKTGPQMQGMKEPSKLEVVYYPEENHLAIRYHLETAAMTQFELINMLGEPIPLPGISPSWHEKGMYEVTIPIKSVTGNGLFFLRMKTGDQTLTRKVVLVN